jgi:hypothetical protein
LGGSFTCEFYDIRASFAKISRGRTEDKPIEDDLMRRQVKLLLPALLLAARPAGAAAAAPAEYEPHPGTDDANVSPKDAAFGTPFVRPLGAAASPDACAAACIAWTNATAPSQRCLSFTLYNGSAPAFLAGKCHRRAANSRGLHGGPGGPTGPLRWFAASHPAEDPLNPQLR